MNLQTIATQFELRNLEKRKEKMQSHQDLNVGNKQENNRHSYGVDSQENGGIQNNNMQSMVSKVYSSTNMVKRNSNTTVRKKNYNRHRSKSSHFSKAWERMTLRNEEKEDVAMQQSLI